MLEQSIINNSLKSRETILVIDDSPANLDFLYIILDGAGYEVMLEKDGRRGIEQVRSKQVDLILLDVIMPKIDGFEICSILKSEPATKDIPIIFMTALTDAVQKVKGLSLGAVDYVTKPFQQEEVLARIQVHVKLRRLNLELDQQKQQLEQRVQERTAELSQALEELKKTQLQLVQSEKISLLGQIVTGVAHELNNPLGFISSNLHHATQYVQDLIHLVKLYRKQFSNPGGEINNEIEAIDLDHVLEDLPKMISSMKLGTVSIQGIMESLRKFSRGDGNCKKAVDIHDGLETTLMILQHRIKAKAQRPVIEVVKDYGNLPLVECYPGQLNQVFMNLLANAIDALEEGMGNREWGMGNREWGIGNGQFPTPVQTFRRNVSSPLPTPRIKICTTVDNENVTIRIADNGPGMSDSVQSQIFNPFFTTKPQGKGAGLGLSISYQIVVDQHGGELNCISVLGEGTEFSIKIPAFAIQS